MSVGFRLFSKNDANFAVCWSFPGLIRNFGEKLNSTNPKRDMKILFSDWLNQFIEKIWQFEKENVEIHTTNQKTVFLLLSSDWL